MVMDNLCAHKGNKVLGSCTTSALKPKICSAYCLLWTW